MRSQHPIRACFVHVPRVRPAAAPRSPTKAQLDVTMRIRYRGSSNVQATEADILLKYDFSLTEYVHVYYVCV